MSVLAPPVIGVDIVATKRFTPWVLYSDKKLRKLFSEGEIEELAQKKRGHEQFLASRFAVKEAFYKALCAWCVKNIKNIKNFTLLQVARFISVKKTERGVPVLAYQPEYIKKITGLTVLPAYSSVSLAHEREHAIATVLLGGIA